MTFILHSTTITFSSLKSCPSWAGSQSEGNHFWGTHVTFSCCTCYICSQIVCLQVQGSKLGFKLPLEFCWQMQLLFIEKNVKVVVFLCPVVSRVQPLCFPMWNIEKSNACLASFVSLTNVFKILLHLGRNFCVMLLLWSLGRSELSCVCCINIFSDNFYLEQIVEQSE